MKYLFHDLGDEQFEDLVLQICKIILGASAQGFAIGRDGGRDVRFVGTAALIPSTQAPWKGTIVAQAKHTSKINASYGDADFHPAASSVLGKEVGKIAKLVKDGALTHYIVFANRKLPADVNEKIIDWLSDKTNLSKEAILLQSVKDIEDYVHANPQLVELASIDHSQAPLIIDPEDIAQVIHEMARHEHTSLLVDNLEILRVAYTAKNKANEIPDEFADKRWNRYIKETRQFQDFLEDPENQTYADQYRAFAETLDERVSLYKSKGGSFAEWWVSIEDLLFDRDPDLRKKKPVVRALLFYMYWNCDLGTVDVGAK